ncbi:MAG: hypothetical protein M3O50_20725 [Myxococcota bacterium]|nr:hypothetical protein [Myxococcota bacterium]
MSVDHKPSKAKSTAPATPGSDIREERTQQLSAEEISSSLLLEDPSEEALPSSAEELSGSLLLEDPTAERVATPAASDVELPTLQRPVPAPLLARAASVLASPRLTDTGGPPAAVTAGRMPPPAAGASDAPPGNVVVGPPTPARLPNAPSSDVEMTQLPYGPAGRLRSWVGDHLPKGRGARVATCALLGGLALLGIGAALFASKSSGEATGVSPSAAPSTPTASTGALAAPSPAPVSAVQPASTACKVAGTAHVIAPNAMLAPGVEARALGDDVGLGFAPTTEGAMVVRIDRASLSAAESTTVRASGIVRRVTPLVAKKGGLAAAVDADRGDRTLGTRTIAADPPLQIGVSNGHLAWWRGGGASKGKLWALEGEGEVEALRGAVWQRAPDAPDVVVLAFRRLGALWLGAAESTNGLASKRELSRIAGGGSAIGSPAIAVNRGIVLASWAERAAADDPWRLRWVRFNAEEAPGEPATFKPPAGGKGEQAMSPAVSALPGGGFLLVWTEGPAAAHDVRALTLSAGGEPIGAPLAISSEGSNAGEGQGAVGGGGRGLVAFLESDANGFRVMATPIVCGP